LGKIVPMGKNKRDRGNWPPTVGVKLMTIQMKCVDDICGKKATIIRRRRQEFLTSLKKTFDATSSLPTSHNAECGNRVDKL
jgi:hypothetical protein